MGCVFLISLIWNYDITETALMSDSWPGNVCLHIPSRMSQSLAEASQAPEMNVRMSGESDNDITSPVWPVNAVTCWPVSMSQRALNTFIFDYWRKYGSLTMSCRQRMWQSDCHPGNGSMKGSRCDRAIHDWLEHFLRGFSRNKYCRCCPNHRRQRMNHWAHRHRS